MGTNVDGPDEKLVRDSIAEAALGYVGLHESEQDIQDMIAEWGGGPNMAWCALFASRMAFEGIWRLNVNLVTGRLQLWGLVHRYCGLDFPIEASTSRLVKMWPETSSEEAATLRFLLPRGRDVASRAVSSVVVPSVEGRGEVRVQPNMEVTWDGRLALQARAMAELFGISHYDQEMLFDLRPFSPSIFDRGGCTVISYGSGTDAFLAEEVLPRRGDLVWRAGHCGVVVSDSDSDGRFETVEGNYGDRVVHRDSSVDDWYGVLTFQFKEKKK